MPSISHEPSPLPPFLRACRGIPGGPDDRVPVWFMRQAGRSLPEYRALRGGGSILDAIRDPELSAEITLQPVRRYGVDAAILYSDILATRHPEVRVTVVEASNRVGDNVLTTPFAGRPVECGADAFLGRVPEAIELCDELGVGQVLTSPADRSALVWSRGS